MKPISLLCLAGSAALLLASCAKKPALPHLTGADSLAIIRDNTAHRTEVDTFFRTDPSSPFLHDTATHYTGIKWFPIDPLWCAHSALHRYENPDTVVILGTKGEERRELRYGYFTCVLPDDHGAPIALKVNVYKFTPYDGQR